MLLCRPRICSLATRITAATYTPLWKASFLMTQRNGLSASARSPLCVSYSFGSFGEIEDSRVRTVVALIQSEYGRPLTLGHFAEAVNLTPEHLCRIFTRQIGIAPLKYLKLYRLQSARELLENSHLTVKEIMFRVGCNDESHFVRDFEDRFGLSPVRYRELQNQAVALVRNQDLPTEVKNRQ
jgi:transcriptional regulator GlxA family with amidase domain